MARKDSENQKKSMSKLFRGRAINDTIRTAFPVKKGLFSGLFKQ